MTHPALKTKGEDNSLRIFVKEVFSASLPDYDGDTEAMTEDALRGTNTGWWCDLIYTAGMLDLHKEHLPAIRQAIAEYEDETGEFLRDRDGTYSRHNFHEANSKGWTWQEYQQEVIPYAECALWCLRFAVEWYAGQIAGELTND